jgi:hypothetical protein
MTDRRASYLHLQALRGAGRVERSYSMNRWQSGRPTRRYGKVYVELVIIRYIDYATARLPSTNLFE